MVTDNIETPTEQVDVTTPTVTENTELTESVIDAKVNEIMDRFSDKLNEMDKAYQDKINAIQTDYDKLKSENEALRKANANLVLNSSHSPPTIDDFSTVDFSDVDWDEQAKKYMSGLDTKISS